jgi:tetratricopeptide (TPR) repeat protein
MKNLFFSLLLLLSSYNVVAFQDKSKEEISEINTKIQQLLNGAEISVNVLNFEEALSQLNQALDLAKKINDQKSIALSSSVLGQLFYIRHDYDRSITEFQRAVSIQREINDEPGLAYSYLNYAKVLNANGDPNRAFKYLNLAEDFYKKTNDEEYQGIVHLNRAIIYLNTDKNDEVIENAMAELNNAEIYLTPSTNLYERSRLHYFKSRAYTAVKDYTKGEEEAFEALRLAKENNFTAV